MTTVTIDCSRCGETVEVPVTALLVDAGSGAHEADAGTVHWVCATCGDVVGRSLSWRLLVLLVGEGASVFDEDSDAYDVEEGEQEQPAGQQHPEALPSGPALTPDDLIDLHAWLEQPTWFAELVATDTTASRERGR